MTCKELASTTWPDKAVRTDATRFVMTEIDTTDYEAPQSARLVKKYQVTALPQIILFDVTGVERGRLIGFTGPTKMLEVPKAVR